MSKTILTTVTALPLSLIYFDCLDQARSESERGSTRCNCVKLWQKKTLKCLQQKMPSQAESRSRFIGFAPSGTSTQTSPSSYTSQEYQVSWLIRSLVEIFDKNWKIFPPFEWNTKIQRPGLNLSPPPPRPPPCKKCSQWVQMVKLKTGAMTELWPDGQLTPQWRQQWKKKSNGSSLAELYHNLTSHPTHQFHCNSEPPRSEETNICIKLWDAWKGKLYHKCFSKKEKSCNDAAGLLVTIERCMIYQPNLLELALDSSWVKVGWGWW